MSDGAREVAEAEYPLDGSAPDTVFALRAAFLKGFEHARD